MRVLLFILLLIPLSVSGLDLSFSRDIAPILQAKCLACHDAKNNKGGYRVDTYANLLQPGKTKNPSVVPARPDSSELYKRLVTPDAEDRMPAKDEALPHAQTELFRLWIEQGAPLDSGRDSDFIGELIQSPNHPPPPEHYPFPVPVRALALNSSATELFVGGYNEITVWSVPDGTLLRRLSNVVQRIHGIALIPGTPDLVVVGGQPGRRGEAAVYNLATGNREKVLLTTADELLGLALSPDGKVLAICGSDHAITLFNSVSGEKLLRIPQHVDWVFACSFSPDGSRLVSASRDRTARVYHTLTGELEATYLNHNGPVVAAVFAPDLNTAITAGQGKKIHLWSSTEGKKVAEIGGMAGAVQQLLLAGKSLFAAASDGLVYEYLPSDRKLLRKYTATSAQLLSMTHSANTLAAGSQDGTVTLWNTETGERISSFVAIPGR